MLEIQIPGFGDVVLKYLVCDFSGTLSVDGILIDGVSERLIKLSKKLDLFILTADTHGKAESELSGLNLELIKIKSIDENLQKERFVDKLGLEHVVAVGNGNNDRDMLKVAKIGVAICLNEGLSAKTAFSADIIVNSICDALDLLLYPNRLIATLRY